MKSLKIIALNPILMSSIATIAKKHKPECQQHQMLFLLHSYNNVGPVQQRSHESLEIK